MPEFQEPLEIKNSSGKTTLYLDGEDGKVFFKDIDGNNTLELSARGTVRLVNPEIDRLATTVFLDNKDGAIFLGNKGQYGHLHVRDKNGKETIQLIGQGSVIFRDPSSGKNVLEILGGRRSLKINNAEGKPIIWLQAEHGTIIVGSEGQDGTLYLKDSKNKFTLQFIGEKGNIFLFNANGSRAIELWGGGFGDNLNRGCICLNDVEGQPTLRLDSNDASITLGNKGQDGALYIMDNNGKETIHLNGVGGNVFFKDASGKNLLEIWGGSGDIKINNAQGKPNIWLRGKNGTIFVGSKGQDGNLYLNDSKDKSTIHLTGKGGKIVFFEKGKGTLGLSANGTIWMNSAEGHETVRLDSKDGKIRGFIFSLGRKGTDGHLYLNDSNGKTTVHLHGHGGNAWFGGNDVDGGIVIFPSGGTNKGDSSDISEATIHLDGQSGDIKLAGDMVMGSSGEERVQLIPKSGNMWLGGNGADGDFVIFPKNGTNRGDSSDPSEATIHLDGQSGDMVMRSSGKERVYLIPKSGNMWLGGNDVDGDIAIFSSGGTNKGDDSDLSEATIHLDGQSGDIKLAGADCAEEFNVSASEKVIPGTVLVANKEDTLQISKQPYDKRVVGVVSGAGGYKAGIVLDKKSSKNPRVPVALSGKVFCKVDANNSPISVGDLLTTSSTPGHAMKAEDPLKSFGAVVGKALGGLTNGQGLIPILVALQ